ncbi:unnamed protein product [Pylaiella littoralis]
MPTIKTFDFYRKIPLDLTETTLQGAVMSGCALFCMFILFLCELRAFLTPEVYSTVAIDSNQDSKLRINFNITMLALPCDYASVDVLDLLGTNKVNMTQNIVKWHTDDNGFKREFHGRNKAQENLKHDDHHRDLDLAHEDGEHAVPLTGENFKDFVDGNDHVMVDFYAPWCVWCIKLAPTWEAFAEEAERSLDGKLRVAKVDCVAERDLCATQNLMAFPTIRVFRNGEPDGPDYAKDRSVEPLMQFAAAKIGGDEKILRRRDRAVKQDYPGCQLSGFLMVNRVPGNFHVEARSAFHSIDPTAANVSHVVKTLKFGTQFPLRGGRRAASPGMELEGLSSLDDRVYTIDVLHTAPHHYIKVVSTFVGDRQPDQPNVDGLQYQMMVSSQIMPYDEDQVPEAKFSYDLSPMSVYIKQRRRKWYDFLTSVLAIVGGTFTVVGVLDNILFRVVKQKKI